MHLSDHDLRQLDEAYLDTLAPKQARVLLGKAQADWSVALMERHLARLEPVPQ